MCLIFPDGALANSKMFFFWLPNNLSVSLLFLVPTFYLFLLLPVTLINLLISFGSSTFTVHISFRWLLIQCETAIQCLGHLSNIQNCISVAISPVFYSYQSCRQLQKIFSHRSIPDHLDIMETSEWSLDNPGCPEYTSVHKLPRPACKLSVWWQSCASAMQIHPCTVPHLSNYSKNENYSTKQNKTTQNKNMDVVTWVTEGHCKNNIKNKTPENLPYLYITISIYKISLICYNIITNGRYENDVGVMAVENYNVYVSFMRLHSPIFRNKLRKALDYEV